MNKKKVYICGSLEPSSYEYITRTLSSKIADDYVLMRPGRGQLHEKPAFVEIDVAMIKHCDMHSQQTSKSAAKDTRLNIGLNTSPRLARRTATRARK